MIASIKRYIDELFNSKKLESIAKETDLCVRKRKISIYELVMSLIFWSDNNLTNADLAQAISIDPQGISSEAIRQKVLKSKPC